MNDPSGESLTVAEAAQRLEVSEPVEPVQAEGEKQQPEQQGRRAWFMRA